MKRGDMAIHGGPKVRQKPLPSRRLFGENELAMIQRVFQESWSEGVDFGYQGRYEELYVESFCAFQGGGFADAVSSGTAGIYLAMGALGLEAGDDVVVSPVTDPGAISAIVAHGMNLVIADSEPNSFNVGPKEFEAAVTRGTRAALVTHVGGVPVDLDPIIELARRRGIKVIEDCSQAHGAIYKGLRVGRRGDIAVFSTMFSKNHATGGCGGLVYTENEDYYWSVRSLADRGKPFRDPAFDPRDPRQFLFPALNFNLDELSCAIGLSTLSRLQDTIDRRNEIARKIDDAIRQRCRIVFPCERRGDCTPAPFFHTVGVDVARLAIQKEMFAEAVRAEGIWVNPHYKYVVSEWPWVKQYTRATYPTPHAKRFRDRSFNILLNERFTDEEIGDVVEAIVKVEAAFAT